MAFPRASTWSYRSRDSTAVDPGSAFSSPNLAQAHIGQRPSTEHGNCESRDPSVSSGSSISPEGQRYGWPRLAEIMAEVPEFAAFPRYRDLNLRNLLYYKAQIDNLKMKILTQEEEQTLELERFDIIANEHNLEEPESVKNYRQMIIDLRALLSGYNEALLQYSNVSALSDPEEHNMRSLREWLATDESTSVRGLAGQDKTWGDPSQSAEPKWARARTVLSALFLAKQPPKSDLDLVITHREAKIDGLTKWVVYWLMPFYWDRRDHHRLAKDARSSDVEMGPIPDTQADAKVQQDTPPQKPPQRDPKTLESASESTALRITSALSTVMACLIPVVAIAALTQLHGTRDLLICITGFAVLFAAGLIFLTQGTSSRTEIFAATAAFSAVMVVFISQPIIQLAPGSSVSVEM